jgi:hypothetical protein
VRFLRRHQDIQLNDEARKALAAECKAFLETGLSFAEWDSFSEDEQAALVSAARVLEAERLTRWTLVMKAQTPVEFSDAISSLDGGRASRQAHLDLAVANAAKNMNKPSFAGVTH